MYTLIGHHKSRAFRVQWMLEEAGLDYTHVAARPHEDEVKALNPSGKIPVLVDGEDVLTDSLAIMTYLGDKHHVLTAPAGTLDRARQDAMSNLLNDEFDALIWTASRHTFVLPEEHRLPAIKDSLRWEFKRNARRLSASLGDKPFLCGDQITIPDIIAGHCLGWAIAARFPHDDANLNAYLGRLRARPAFRKAAGGR